MIGGFTFPCPDCGRTNAIHERHCEYIDTHITSIRKAYYDILSTLLAMNAERVAYDAPPGVTWKQLVDEVNQMLEEEAWRSIHTDCLHHLKHDRRVEETEEMGGLYIRNPSDRRSEIIPTFDPIKTIYEHGPIDGCKDFAVYSMISWCDLVGLDWEQTCNFIHEWMDETGAWEEQHWGEESVQSLLNDKRHIHQKSMGWAGIAGPAAQKIKQSDHEKRIDADDKRSVVDGDHEYYSD